MRSGGQGGPQARARLRALSLTAVSPPASSIRSKKADLVLDTQHGIYRDITQRRRKATDYTERKDFQPLRGAGFNDLLRAAHNIYPSLCNLWLFCFSV